MRHQPPQVPTRPINRAGVVTTLACLPGLQDHVGQAVFHDGVSADTKYHVVVELRLTRHQVGDDIHPYHLLVHRVGLDVLTVKRDAFRWRVEPSQRLDQAAGAG